MTSDNDNKETTKLRLKGSEIFSQWHQLWRATLAVNRKWQESISFGDAPDNTVSINVYRDETVNASGHIVKRINPTATQQDLIDACKTWLIKSIDFNHVDIDAEDCIRDILRKLTTEYGQIIGNAHERKEELGHELYFDPNANPIKTLKWLDQQQILLKQSGANISFEENQRIVKRGISHEDDHLKVASKFWLEFRRILMACSSPADIRTKMVEYWVLYQDNSIVKKETTNTKRWSQKNQVHMELD